jgi:hypothetical protein
MCSEEDVGAVGDDVGVGVGGEVEESKGGANVLGSHGVEWLFG